MNFCETNAQYYMTLELLSQAARLFWWSGIKRDSFIEELDPIHSSYIMGYFSDL